VTALARHCRVRRQLLFEHFKRGLRKSPETWIKERAMQRAAQLLAETDLPMHKIAAKCGIAQRTNLSKRFKEHFGMPPNSYRKQIRGGHRGRAQ
jgi:transcriptional regulator GlxA family with amidase domain